MACALFGKVETSKGGFRRGIPGVKEPGVKPDTKAVREKRASGKNLHKSKRGARATAKWVETSSEEYRRRWSLVAAVSWLQVMERVPEQKNRSARNLQCLGTSMYHRATVKDVYKLSVTNTSTTGMSVSTFVYMERTATLQHYPSRTQWVLRTT